MTRRLVAMAMAPVLLALGLLAVRADDVDALTGATVRWPNSRVIIGTDGSAFTSGAWLRSASGEVFMTLPAHAVRACQSCPLKPSSVQFRFEGSVENVFTTSNVVFPTNPLFSFYDIALVNFGPAGATPAETGRGHYYCTEANCTADFGNGTAANPNWAGQAIDIVGATNAEEGWGVYMNKAVSGTSEGTVIAALHAAYDGWDYWGIHTTVGRCGVTHGDSGSPVLTGPLAQSLLLGVLVSSGPSWWETSGNACYSGTRFVAGSQVMVAWADIRSAWSGLGLQPVTYL